MSNISRKNILKNDEKKPEPKTYNKNLTELKWSIHPSLKGLMVNMEFYIERLKKTPWNIAL